jgi:hypothetical protein
MLKKSDYGDGDINHSAREGGLQEIQTLADELYGSVGRRR